MIDKNTMKEEEITKWLDKTISDLEKAIEFFKQARKQKETKK